MDYYEEGNTTDLKGFEADFARAVCEKLGVTPTFQVISWEAKESELNSKNVDCLWNGLTITDARKNTMSISTPYMANKQVLITKSENADKYSSAGSLKGATVVAEKNPQVKRLQQATHSLRAQTTRRLTQWQRR